MLLIDLPAIDLGALGHGLQEGMQTELGAEWTFYRGNQLNLTGYFNPLFRTVELGVPGGNAVNSVPGVNPQLDPVTRGEAFGLELLLRHPLGGNWFGWLSCALAWSLRYQTYELLDANGNPLGATASGYLPFAFDQTFIANAALTYRFPKGWSAGAVVHFNTGRPESGVLGSYTEVKGTVNGQPAWVPVQLNDVDRLPPFYRIDLQVSKTWTFDQITLEAYFDLMNATVSWETLGFQYETSGGGSGSTPTLSKVPISIPIVVPMLGLRGTY